MPRAGRAADDPIGDPTAPQWLTDAVGGVWGRSEWTHWRRRVRPGLEERGVTMEMLEPLYGAQGNDLIGVAARPEGGGLRVGWVGDAKHGRAAILRAAGELVRELDRPTRRGPQEGPAPEVYGDWMRRSKT